IPGSAYPIYRLVITAGALVAGLLLYLLITRTRVGALIRAGRDNREIVAALGLNINLLYTLIFPLRALFAALAGIHIGPRVSGEPGAGDPILILALVVVVIGGIGSVRGALVGALMVGIFDTLSRVLIPLVVQTNATSALVGMAVYVLMAVVLLFSRTGLFAAHRGSDVASTRCAALPSARRRDRAAALLRHLLHPVRDANRHLRHGGAQRRPSARLWRADHLRTGGVVRCRGLRRGHADGLRPHRRPGDLAARRSGIDAVRIGDRSAVAAHARLPVHHGDARLCPDGLLLRPELAQLGRR